MFQLKYRFTFGILAVLILLIFLHYTGILSPFESFLTNVLTPAQSTVYKISNFTTRIVNPNQSQDDLNTKVISLQDRVNMLLIKNQKLQILLDDQKSAAIQLEFLQDKYYDHVISKVIGEDSSKNINAIVIDKGLKDGIQIDMPVIVDDGIIIGKIIEVEQSFSKVLLVTDPRSQIAATINNSEQTSGVVSGDFGLIMKMELIEKDIQLENQDIVSTSGLEQNIPRGLIIGEVVRIEEEPNEFFKTAYLQSLKTLKSINVVSVIVLKDF